MLLIQIHNRVLNPIEEANRVYRGSVKKPTSSKKNTFILHFFHNYWQIGKKKLIIVNRPNNVNHNMSNHSKHTLKFNGWV